VWTLRCCGAVAWWLVLCRVSCAAGAGTAAGGGCGAAGGGTAAAAAAAAAAVDDTAGRAGTSAAAVVGNSAGRNTAAGNAAAGNAAAVHWVGVHPVVGQGPCAWGRGMVGPVGVLQPQAMQPRTLVAGYTGCGDGAAASSAVA